MKSSEAKKLLGRVVSWIDVLDSQRGTYKTRRGVLERVSGNNALIDGEWRWLPALHDLKSDTA